MKDRLDELLAELGITSILNSKNTTESRKKERKEDMANFLTEILKQPTNDGKIKVIANFLTENFNPYLVAGNYLPENSPTYNPENGRGLIVFPSINNYDKSIEFHALLFEPSGDRYYTMELKIPLKGSQAKKSVGYEERIDDNTGNYLIKRVEANWNGEVDYFIDGKTHYNFHNILQILKLNPGKQTEKIVMMIHAVKDPEIKQNAYSFYKRVTNAFFQNSIDLYELRTQDK